MVVSIVDLVVVVSGKEKRKIRTNTIDSNTFFDFFYDFYRSSHRKADQIFISTRKSGS